MRGLLIASGRYNDAESILLEWAGTLSEGMLPNRFPDHGGTPEYNSVDASLWFVIAVHDYLATGHAHARDTETACSKPSMAFSTATQAARASALRVDDDGLLRAGVPGVQLTWMDAKVGDWVVTPRIGKPVEVQALWINALRIAARLESALERTRSARASLVSRNASSIRRRGALFDVVDADHEPGKIDRSIRPNQIFAVGGLPFPLLEGAARAGCRRAGAKRTC